MIPEVQEFGQQFATWRHDDIQRLSSIEAWTKLLPNIKGGELNDEQSKAIQIIRGLCNQGIAAWRNRTIYITVCFNPEEITWKATSLPHSIEEAVQELCQGFGLDTIRVDIPDGLPLVKSNIYLTTAILNLIYPEPYFVPYLKDCAPSIKVYLRESDILVEIHNGQKSHSPRGERPDLAELIIQQHGTQLASTYSPETGTDYQFTLSIWNEAN